MSVKNAILMWNIKDYFIRMQIVDNYLLDFVLLLPKYNEHKSLHRLASLANFMN